MIRQFLTEYCAELGATLAKLPLERFEEFVVLLESAYREERQVFMLGNGGSGSTASHIVCDLVKGVSYGLPKRFRAICLNDNVPTLMAYANDLSYEEIFVEPLKNFLHPGDLVIGLSGSGNSPNVLKAIDYANQHGAHTVGLSGFGGGKLAKLAHTSVVAPVNDMQKSEDTHLILLHAAFQVLCARLRSPSAPPAGEVVAGKREAR